jgi:hypothetical protein
MLEMRAETWLKEWKEEGRQRGIQEEKVTLLMRLLEHRFGSLPDWAVDRIQTRESATLDQWVLRVLDVKTLENVLR